MSQDIGLKQLERKAWRSVFQDGLWDIYLGLLLMAMAMLVLLSRTNLSETQQMLIYIGLMALAMLVLWAGKHFITTPRMGRVKFGQKRKRKLNLVRVILAVSVLVGALLATAGTVFLRGEPPDWLDMRFIIPAIWAVNMLFLFGLGAYLLDYNRLYLIGVLYALPVPVDFWLRELAGVRLGFIAFAVPAAVILIVGLAAFIRFLHDYPPPAEESPPAEGAFHGNH